MQISATVRNASSRHEVFVSTGSAAQSLAVPPKPSGQGSAVNGGEFLMLAMAACYCNDLYREASKLGISIESVDSANVWVLLGAAILAVLCVVALAQS